MNLINRIKQNLDYSRVLVSIIMLSTAITLMLMNENNYNGELKKCLELTLMVTTIVGLELTYNKLYQKILYGIIWYSIYILILNISMDSIYTAGLVIIGFYVGDYFYKLMHPNKNRGYTITSNNLSGDTFPIKPNETMGYSSSNNKQTAPKKLITVKDQIVEYGTNNNYDGLFNVIGGCACTLQDLAPCGHLNESECTYGYKHDDPTGDHDFIISSEK